MRTRWGTAALAMAALAVGTAGCSRMSPAWQDRGGPPRVVVTVPALESFVRNVGGDHVGVVSLCTNQGPHGYQYTPRDADLLRGADLFFAVGLTLDDNFADPVQVESHNARLRYVKLGERLLKLDEHRAKGEKLVLPMRAEHGHGDKEDEHGHDHGHAHGHAHQHGKHDPHVWLGIPQAVEMVRIICDELKKADDAHKDDYDKNAAAFIKRLEKLQADGKALLKEKKNRKVVAFHESLAYFASTFGVEIFEVIEVIPGAEPPASHMAHLIDECVEHDVRVLAVEPQYPKGSAAEVLQKGLQEKGKKAVLVEVDPLETADEKDLTATDWYEQKMRKNLAELAKALP